MGRLPKWEARYMTTDRKNPEYEEYIRLLTTNQRRIYGFINAMLPNQAVSDDIMQETSLLMWQNFEQFQKGTNFAAWGMSIARNLVMQHYRKQKRNRLTFDLEAIENIASQSDVFDSVDDKVDALRQCFKKLNSNDKKILEQRYIDNSPVQKIAETVNCTPGHMYRIMAKIHDLLLRCIKLQLS